jgi:hypothetical protein
MLFSIVQQRVSALSSSSVKGLKTRLTFSLDLSRSSLTDGAEPEITVDYSVASAYPMVQAMPANDTPATAPIGGTTGTTTTTTYTVPAPAGASGNNSTTTTYTVPAPVVASGNNTTTTTYTVPAPGHAPADGGHGLMGHLGR